MVTLLILDVELNSIGGVPFGVYAIVQVQYSTHTAGLWLILDRISALLSSFSLKLLPASRSFHGGRHSSITSRVRS